VRKGSVGEERFGGREKVWWATKLFGERQKSGDYQSCPTARPQRLNENLNIYHAMYCYIKSLLTTLAPKQSFPLQRNDLFPLDDIRRLLRNRIHSSLEMRRRDKRHDARIYDPQALDTIHPEFRVNTAS
jgi:hypothetical protein